MGSSQRWFSSIYIGGGFLSWSCFVCKGITGYIHTNGMIYIYENGVGPDHVPKSPHQQSIPCLLQGTYAIKGVWLLQIDAQEEPVGVTQQYMLGPTLIQGPIVLV